MSNNKTYLLVVVLVVLNVVSLGALWVQYGKNTNTVVVQTQDPAESMAELLDFDKTQLQQLKDLRKDFFDRTRPMHRQVMESRTALFELAKEDIQDSVAVSEALNNLATAQGQMELAVFNHFSDIRALCKGEQKERFDEVFEQILKLNGPGGGPRNGPPGGPPTGGGRPPHL